MAWTRVVSALACIVAVFSTTRAAPPMTYQGVLEDGGSRANGQYDISFEVFDAETGGTSLARRTVSDVPVLGGVFSVEVPGLAELGVENDELWLGISVRESGAPGGFVTLSPRQRAGSVPYAARAMSVDAVLSLQIVDETGVASVSVSPTGTATFVANPVEVASATISCPADGYVLAIASVSVGTLAFDTDYRTVIAAWFDVDGEAPYGDRTWLAGGITFFSTGAQVQDFSAITPVEVIPVSAGDTTVSLWLEPEMVSGMQTGVYYLDTPSLTLVYLPTGYGAVVGGPTPAPRDHDSISPRIRSVPPPRRERSEADWAQLLSRIERLEGVIRDQQHQIDELTRTR